MFFLDIFGHANLALLAGGFTMFHIWVWINTSRYIFSGMNIHLPAILGFTRYQGFDPSPYDQQLSTIFGVMIPKFQGTFLGGETKNQMARFPASV